MREMLLGVVLFLLAQPVCGQGLMQSASAPGPSGTVTDVPAAEIKATAEKQPASMPLSDQLLRVVDINGEYNVGVAIVHRAKPASAPLPNGMQHSHVAEVYIMLSGNATLVTGGTIDNLKDIGNDGRTGPTSSGRAIQNGVSQEMGPGDIVIIPPGTPHYFSEIKSDEISYLVDRVDPYRLLAMPGQTVGKTTATPAAPGTATFVNGAEVQAAATGPGIGKMLRVVSINNGEYYLGVGLLHRTAIKGDTIEAHSQITEFYHILSGNATFETGGTMDNIKPDPPNPRSASGPGFGGSAIRDGISREVGPGDVEIIPPNTPHTFSKIQSDNIVYLVVRIDPHRVLPLSPADAGTSR